MSSTPKKIVGGLLAGLLALFAAVVVATPAVADEAAPLAWESETAGYRVVATNPADTNPATVDAGAISNITKSITITPIAGEQQQQLTINGWNNAKVAVTLSGINTSINGNAALVLTGTDDVNLVLDGDNTFSCTSGNASAITIANGLDVNITGNGSLTARTLANGAATVALAGGDGADLVIGDGETTPKVTLSNSNNAALSLGKGNLTVGAGATLNCNVTASATTGSAAVLVTDDSDATGTITVEGTMNVNVTNDQASIAGINAEDIVVGDSEEDSEATGSLAVNVAGSGQGISLTGVGDGTAGALQVNNGSLYVSTVSAAGINAGGASSYINLAKGTTTTVEVNAASTATTEASAITASDDTINVNGGATLDVTVGGATGNAGTSNAAIAGGTLNVGSGSGTDLVGGTVSVESNLNPAISAKLAVNGATDNVVTATSAKASGIVTAGAASTIAGGTVAATGGLYGINATTGGLTVSNGTGNGGPKAMTAGPTVIAKSTAARDAAAVATSGDNANIQATTGAKKTTYYWIAAAGNEDGSNDNPVEVVGFAGMTGNTSSAAQVLNLNGANNYVEITPAPMSASEVSVVPTNSASNADKNTSVSGYMIANLANSGATTGFKMGTGIYSYQPVVVPSGFTGVDYPVAEGLTAAVTLGALNGEGAITITGMTDEQIVVDSTNAALAATSDASGNSFTLELGGDTITGGTYDTLYADMVPNAGTIKMSYQVTFDTNSVGSTLTPAPTEAALTGSGNNVYLTLAGTGTLNGGANPTVTTNGDNESVVPTSLPALQASSGVFLSWYNQNEDGDPTTQVPQTQLTGYTQNTELLAEGGTITYAGITPSPVNVTNGNSSNASVTATVTPTYKGLDFDMNASGLASTQWLVPSTAGNAWTLGSGAAQNGVTVATSTMTQGTNGTWTISAAISAANNAVPNTYTLTFQPAGTKPSTVNNAVVVVGGARVTIAGNGTVTQQVASNGDVHLTATPGSGDTFLGWYGPNGNLITSSSTLDVPSGTQVTARFTGQTPGPVAPTDGAVAVSRLYNPNLEGAHLLTSDQTEIAALTTAGWRDEGVKFWVYGNAGTNNVAVYRLYNPNNKDHLYTTSANEADTLASIGWKKDFGGQPAFWGAVSSNIPVLRVYNSHATANGGVGNHLWTTDANEVQTLTNIYGWTPEGTAWYAVANGPTL